MVRWWCWAQQTWLRAERTKVTGKTNRCKSKSYGTNRIKPLFMAFKLECKFWGKVFRSTNAGTVMFLLRAFIHKRNITITLLHRSESFRAPLVNVIVCCSTSSHRKNTALPACPEAQPDSPPSISSFAPQHWQVKWPVIIYKCVTKNGSYRMKNSTLENSVSHQNLGMSHFWGQHQKTIWTCFWYTSSTAQGGGGNFKMGNL